MQAGMRKAEAVGTSRNRHGNCLGAFLFAVMAMVFCLPKASQAQVTFNVGAGGAYKNIQDAVNACPSTGCVINLTDSVYVLDREVWIQSKNQLTIQASPAMQAAGIKPRIYYGGPATTEFYKAGTARNPKDPARPAGWKMWPKTNAMVTQKDYFDSLGLNIRTSGFQQNGYIVVLRSKNVTIDGVKIDGIKPIKFINKGVWQSQYDVYFGNVGVNIFQSYQTTVKNTEILNCFSAVYMNGRNIGGALAIANPDDQDVYSIVPMSRFGQMGDNLFDGNYFHNNWWGIFNESDWDIGSTIRYNIFRYNFNTAYTINNDSSSENNNQAGGVMYLKDAMLVPHKFYNNTIDNCALVFGHGYFKAGRQVYFYNNLVTNWYHGNDANLRKMLSDERQLLDKYSDFVYNNTFTADTFRTQSQSNGQLNSSDCNKLGLNSCWISFDKSVNELTGISTNLWMWNDWKVKQGGHYTATYKGKPYSFSDNQAINFYDLGGTFATMGTLDVSARGNNWAQTISYLDTNSAHVAAPKFMFPDSTTSLVDSTLFHSGWEATGRRLSDGSMPWRGAKPAGTEVLELKDQSKVTINSSGKVTFTYNLNSAVSGWTNLKWSMANYYAKCPRASGVAGEYPAPISLTAIDAPVIGTGVFSAKLSAVPTDSFARFDLIVTGTYNGKTVSSNVGSWIYRKTAYDLDVIFLDSTGKDTIKTARVGEKVKMVLVAKNNGTVLNTAVDSVLASSNKSMYMMPGQTQVLATQGILKGKALNGTDTTVVYWTQTGPVVVNASGTIGTGVFSGSGSITIRPGLPYKAVWQTPPTYSLLDHSLGQDTSIAYAVPQGASQVTLQVVDSLGNNVDTASNIAISTALIDASGITNLQMGNASAGPWTDMILPSVSYPLAVDSTGLAKPYINLKGTPNKRFWGFANVIGKSALDSGLMKVGLPTDRFYLQTDDIDTFVTIRVPVKLVVSQDGGTTINTASDAVVAHLGSKSGSVMFYASDTSTTTLDTINVVGGEVDLWVSSVQPISKDTIYAFNSWLNHGDLSYKYPVTFRTPPIPKYPIVDSAYFWDGNCNATADSVYIKLKAAGAGGSSTFDAASRLVSITLATSAGSIVRDSTQFSYVGTRTDLIAVALNKDSGTTLTGKVTLKYLEHRPPLKDTVITGATYTIGDRIAPRVDSAVMYENDTSASDAFLVRFSKAVHYTDKAWPFITTSDAGVVRDVSKIVVDSFAVAPTEQSLGANTYRIVVHGNRNSSNVTLPLTIQYTDSLKLDPTSTLVDASGNTGRDCYALVPIVKKLVLPSFSGAIRTTDSLGRANLLTVKFVRALKAQEQITSVTVRFGNMTRTIPANATTWFKDATDSSTYSLKIPDSLAFLYGITEGAETDSHAAYVTISAANTSASGSSYMPKSELLKDSVPSVFVNFLSHNKVPAYAQLVFGPKYDTLKVMFSEPMKLASNSAGKVSVRNVKTGNDVGTISVVRIDDLNWEIIQDPTSADHVSTNDWISLGDMFVGADDGLVPVQGSFASKAIVKGSDRPPYLAYYSDPEGIGTATRLTMYFNKHLTHGTAFNLSWGGVSVSDTLDSAVAVASDSLVLDLAKYNFPIGVTGPADGLSATLQNLTSEDTLFPLAPVTFAVVDSVPPVLNSAHMAFGSYADALTSQDTLKVSFSEPVKFTGDANNAFLVFRHGTDSTKTVIGIRLVMLPGDTSAWMYFDTTANLVVPYNSDSLRLIMGSAIVDAHGNVVGAKSRYVPVTAGMRPAINPTLVIILPNKSSSDYLLSPNVSTSPLAWSGSNVVIITRRSGDASGNVKSLSTSNSGVSWSQLGGTIGVELPSINEGTIMEHSVLSGYIYDKYGVYVGRARADLYPSDFKSVEDATGKFNIQILWDGRAADGSLVADGIYTMRILLIQDVKLVDGTIQNKMKWNYLRNIGVRR